MSDLEMSTLQMCSIADYRSSALDCKYSVVVQRLGVNTEQHSIGFSVLRTLQEGRRASERNKSSHTIINN